MLVHHGLFWTFDPPGLTPLLAERLRPLFEHDIALAAYHLPLDAHPELGNNALLAEALGAAEHVAVRRHRPRRDVRRARAGRRAVRARRRRDRPRAARVRRRAAGDPAPRDRLRRAPRAGSARRVAEGYDAFLTGEPKEHVMADAREAGIHFVARRPLRHRDVRRAPRWATWLAERFGVEHVWVDLPNPV